MIQHWNGIRGTFTVEVDEDIPDCLKNLMNRPYGCYELVIEFESKGWYDPGKFSGHPETCYPPEGDEDRRPLEGYLRDEWYNKTPLDQEILETVFDYYIEDIAEMEIDITE